MASIVPDLLDMFPDDVVVESGTRDSWGTFTPVGSSRTVKAQVSQKVRLVRDVAGREQVSSVQAIIAGAFGLKTTDRYTLPPRFSPDQPEPMAVKHMTDEDGAHHEVVYFK